MNTFNQVLRMGTQSTANDHGSSIDYLRVIGPARERLLNRLGTDQLEALGVVDRFTTLPIEVGIATDKGLRHRNEDSAVVMVGRKQAVNGIAPVIFAAVADGMGGYTQGDVASAAAIETLTETVTRNFFLSDDTEPLAAAFDAYAIDQMLEEAVTDAHRAVRQEAPEGGTTLTCVLVWNNMLHVAHVGDSRVYLVKAGSVDVLTVDHRLVRQLEAIGALTPEDAVRHPKRNVLYRVLGLDEGFKVDVMNRPLRSTSRLLLCTDGVWGPLHTNDIYMWVLLGQSPQDICERLLHDAMLRQSNDNATAILLHIPAKT